MQLPKKFRLKGKLWRVVNSKDLTHEDGTKCDGVCDTDARVIHIDSAVKGKRRLATFLHELFHAMVHETHIPANAALTESIEDILADALGDLFTHDFEINLMEKYNE